MLYKKDQQPRDAEAVVAWLTPLVEKRAEQGVSRSDMAAACGVSPQAFNGWLKTGRITKANLTKAVAYFGSSPDFSGRGLTAGEPSAATWPFRKFSAAQVSALPPELLLLLEDTVAAFLRSAKPTPTSSQLPIRVHRNKLAEARQRQAFIRAVVVNTLEEIATSSKSPTPTQIADLIMEQVEAAQGPERQNPTLSTTTKPASSSS